MKYWIIDGDEDTRYESADEVCEYVFDPDNYDDDDAVDEWINDCYYDQKVTINGETYYPATIVKELDSYNYRELAREWAQERSESDTEYYYSDIDNMEDGDKEYFNNYTVECIEEEELDVSEEEVNEGFDALVNVSVAVTSDKPVNIQVIA